MFAKNKPTKKMFFGENNEHTVILQHLSKGIKDEYTSQLAELSLSLKGIDKQALENQDMSALPDSIESVLKKINELEYFKLSHAIKEWSAEDPISVDSVKELDDEVFNQLAKEVDKMNKLTEIERKN